MGSQRTSVQGTSRIGRKKDFTSVESSLLANQVICLIKKKVTKGEVSATPYLYPTEGKATSSHWGVQPSPPPNPGSGCTGMGHHSIACLVLAKCRSSMDRVPGNWWWWATYQMKPASASQTSAFPQSCHPCHWLLFPRFASYRQPDHGRKRMSLQVSGSGGRNQESCPWDIHCRCGHGWHDCCWRPGMGRNTVNLNKVTSSLLTGSLTSSASELDGSTWLTLGKRGSHWPMWGPSSPVGPCLLFFSMKAMRVAGPRVQERIFNLPESRAVEIVTVFSWMLNLTT